MQTFIDWPALYTHLNGQHGFGRWTVCTGREGDVGYEFWVENQGEVLIGDGFYERDGFIEFRAIA